MAAFLSTFENKIDAKGRVSVPAPFRNELEKQESKAVILYPSLKYPCLEGSGDERMQQIIESIDALPAFSDERDDLETILADSRHLNIDGDGRIVLPPDFIEFAELKSHVIFAGMGKGFQMWKPDTYMAHRKVRRARALGRGATLRIIEREERRKQ